MSEPAPRAERKTPPTPIPFTVLTGFLGAGKTTLLNRLLKDPALAETAVVINEFGEIGLDHLLVEYVSDNMVLLQSGCLCCTMRGDLVDALETLLRDLDNRRCTFKRLLLETTGLADPAPVLHTAMSHPYLVLRYRLDGVITVADAAAGQATLDAHLEAVKQAAVADRIVLTKTDIVDEARRQRIIARLRALNPAAPILDAAKGEAIAAGMPEDRMPTVTVREEQSTPATFNTEKFARHARELFSAHFGADRLASPPPAMVGEDFSRFYLTDQSIESLLIWVGGTPKDKWDAAGGDPLKLPSLHSPYWAPDAEAVISTATEAMTVASLDVLKKG